MASMIVLAAVLDAAFKQFHIAFSSAVLGLIVLLCAIGLRRRVDTPLERAAHGLLRWFPLFFVPSTVGVIDYGSAIGRSWIGITAALVISTLLGIAVAAIVGAFVAQRVRAAS